MERGTIKMRKLSANSLLVLMVKDYTMIQSLGCCTRKGKMEILFSAKNLANPTLKISFQGSLEKANLESPQMEALF